MRRPIVWAAIIALIMMAGCQNQELLRCQQEKQDLQAQVEKLQEDLINSMTVFNEMLGLVETQNKKLQKDLDAAVEQTRAEVEAQFTETVNTLRRQLDEKNQALLLAQKEIKKLKALIKELEKKIKRLEGASTL